MKRRKKKSLPRLLGLALIVATAAGYYWLRPGNASTEPESETVPVRREDLDRTVAATGVIRPMVGAEIDVGSRVSGIVRSIPVEVGDSVGKGDLLAVIDPTELESETDQARADLALAEAQLAMAESSFQRAAELAGQGILAEAELESAGRDLEVARAQVDLERAQLESAGIRLGYTEIRAPIRGVIADVTTREGETVAASFAAPTFVTIVDLDRLEVLAYVDETDIGRIFLGQRASFTVDTYPEVDFNGRVTAIDPKAELQNGVVNYIVRLALEDPDPEAESGDPATNYTLRPEMTAHVRLQVDRRRDALTIPRKAIRREQGRELVSVDRDGLWADQMVETGWRADGRVEIVKGLTEGETVRLNEE